MLSSNNLKKEHDDLETLVTLFPNGQSEISSDFSILSEELGTVKNRNFTVLQPNIKTISYFDYDDNIGTWAYRDDVEIEYEIYDEKTKFHYYAVQEELSSVKQLTFTNVNSDCDFDIKLIIYDTSYGPFKSKNNMMRFRFKGFNNKNANLTHDLNRDCFTGHINIIPSVKSLMMTKLEYHTYNHLGLPVN